MKMEIPAVQLENISFQYDREPVLENVSFQVAVDDFIGMVGPNGGGKTTLLKIILGLIQPNAGSVKVFGQPPSKSRSQLGYVPQQINLDREFPISVIDVVLLGRLGQTPLFGRYRRIDREEAREALHQVDLLDFKDRHFGALSGGQRQRVLIARALAARPRLLIMDEPTSNVDSLSQQQIYDLLCAINQQCAIILVSHDVGVVSTYVKRVACLNRRLVTHPVHEITDSTIQDLYCAHVSLVNHKSILNER